VFPGVRAGQPELPVTLDGQIPQEPLHGVNIDWLIEPAAVAGDLARVIAGPAHDGGQRIVLD
jgi:hypothetical protein